MSNDMTAKEFEDMRSGDKPESKAKEDRSANKRQEFVDSMTTKAFLIGRTKETITVPITSDDGTKDIEIRARLSKKETNIHAEFLKVFRGAADGEEASILYLDTDAGDLITAAFMAQITGDPQLDTTFWLSDQIDPATAQEILIAYFTEPARRRVEIEKFRKERLRSELHGDATGMGDSPE